MTTCEDELNKVCSQDMFKSKLACLLDSGEECFNAESTPCHDACLKGEKIDFDSISVLSLFEVFDLDENGDFVSTHTIELPQPKHVNFSGTIDLEDMIRGDHGGQSAESLA